MVQHVAASKENQALSAIVRACEHVLQQPLDRVTRARRPKRLPVALTVDGISRPVVHSTALASWFVHQPASVHSKRRSMPANLDPAQLAQLRLLLPLLTPRTADEFFLRGGIYDVLGERQLAIQDLTKAIALCPNHERALVLRAKLFENTREFARALEDFKNAGHDINAPEFIGGRVREAQQNDDHETALFWVLRALQASQMEQKWHGFFLEEKGHCYRRLKRYEEAVSAYREVLLQWPDRVTAWSGMAMALDHLHRFEEAVSCWDQVLRLEPNRPNARENRERSLAAARGQVAGLVEEMLLTLAHLSDEKDQDDRKKTL